jgi:hypothetical protein
MTLDYASLDQLRQTHPAWRLLASPHAALVASFLQRVFIAPNLRVIAQADLAEALEDELFGLRERLTGGAGRAGETAFPKPALDYLNDWAAGDKGWLRKFYAQGSDEPQFDLTPATERAIGWLASLSQRQFVGTESRLLTLFDLLKQMSEGSQTDAEARLHELQKRRDAIDAEMERVRGGDMALLDDTALKDRFQQFMQIARELLSDFREVEQNFQSLDRRVRERIALWDGSKGLLLADIMGERDAISQSDQGRSFRAFWDFLMSSSRQDELTQLLAHVLSLDPVAELKPDQRIKRVHYDWLEAGEHTQRTVAQLSQQLRRFLDDKAWLENRRIMDLLRSIEARALGLRDTPPPGEVMTVADSAAEIELPMERPLHQPSVKPAIAATVLEAGDEDGSDTLASLQALYAQVVVDPTRLSRHVRRSLADRAQVTLAELCVTQPLQQGLAELVGYLQLSDPGFKTVIDDTISETISWQPEAGMDGAVDNSSNNSAGVLYKRARLPRVIFVK